MKASAELPPLLWPFRASEIYAANLNGARFVFADPPPPRAELIIHGIRELQFELLAMLKFVRHPRLRPLQRQHAAALVAEARAELVRQHLKLRRLSIGFRASPTSPVHLWP